MKHIKKGLIAFCYIKTPYECGSAVLEAYTTNKLRVRKYTLQIFDLRILDRLMKEDNIDWVLDSELVKKLNVEVLSD